MGETIPVAVPRKGRPLESVLFRLADQFPVAELADEISSTLRHEKAVTKGTTEPSEENVYRRLAAYSSVAKPMAPEYTLLRDDRAGKPRRIVFDSVTIPLEEIVPGAQLTLVGREEPFRALRTHEFALAFDSADLILEEVVQPRSDPIRNIAEMNARINPTETDVRVVAGLGDTVYHTVMATPDVLDASTALDRSFLEEYTGSVCIVPRYERLVQAVLGTKTLEGIEFEYPAPTLEEEAEIARTGVGIYLTVTGSTARDHGLLIGEQLFPSETVLMENTTEIDEAGAAVRSLLGNPVPTSELSVHSHR